MANLVITYNGTTFRDVRGANSTAPAFVYDGRTISSNFSGDHTLKCNDTVAKTDIKLGNKILQCSGLRFASDITTSYHNPFDSSLTSEEKLNAIAQYVDAYYNGQISNLRDYFTPGDSVSFSMPSFIFNINNRYAQNGDYFDSIYLYTPPATVTARIIGIDHDYLASNASQKAALTFQINAFVSGSNQLGSNGGQIVNANGLYNYNDLSSWYWDSWAFDLGDGSATKCTERLALNHDPDTLWTSCFKTALPSQLSSRLKLVKKYSYGFEGSESSATQGNAIVSETSDYVFIPSLTEILGGSAGISEGNSYQYEYFSENSSASNSGYATWTRSMAGRNLEYYVAEDKSKGTLRPYNGGPAGLGGGQSYSHTFCFCL